MRAVSGTVLTTEITLLRAEDYFGATLEFRVCLVYARVNYKHIDALASLAERVLLIER